MLDSKCDCGGYKVTATKCVNPACKHYIRREKKMVSKIDDHTSPKGHRFALRRMVPPDDPQSDPLYFNTRQEAFAWAEKYTSDDVDYGISRIEDEPIAAPVDVCRRCNAEGFELYDGLCGRCYRSQ